MKNKRNVGIVAAILVVICSLAFLLVEVTANFVIAYVFALVGIAALVACTFVMLNKKDSYPWIAALPMQALLYFIIEVAVSLVVVLLEQLHVFALPAVWTLVIHAVILAGFAIRAILLRGGADYIDRRGAQVREQTQFIQTLRADAQSLLAKAADGETKAACKKVYEAVRYADPMSDGALKELEAQIAERFTELSQAVTGAGTGEAQALADELVSLLADRNQKCKLSK